jgi:hypothetical protein
MFAALLPLLPLATALKFPHIPTPQEALDVAGSILHPGVTLTHGNDMRLSSVPTDDHLVVTSAMHPVSYRHPHRRYELTNIGLQASDQVSREVMV